jgi:hypothetical protein
MAPGVGYNPEALKIASDFPELVAAGAVAAVISASGCANALEISAALRRFEASGRPKVERAYSDVRILTLAYTKSTFGAQSVDRTPTFKFLHGNIFNVICH